MWRKLEESGRLEGPNSWLTLRLTGPRGNLQVSQLTHFLLAALVTSLLQFLQNFTCSQNNIPTPWENFLFPSLSKVKGLDLRRKKVCQYSALTCFRQFLSPFRPRLMHSICMFILPLKWKERKIPCCLAIQCLLFPNCYFAWRYMTVFRAPYVYVPWLCVPYILCSQQSLCKLLDIHIFDK